MYKKIILFSIIFFFFFENSFANNYIERTIDGHKFRTIKYDVKSKDYIFKIGINPDFGATSLRELMEKNNGVSAINGVFFCPASYSECGGKNFTNNERYFKGIKIGTSSSTQDRVVFAIDKKNKPFLYQTNKLNMDRESDIYYGFANFPLLLQDGESKIQDYIDLGLVDSKMTAKIDRNFICSDITNRFIYTGYVSSISLLDLPDLLLKFGCYNALNLDAGGSSAMIYNGRYILGPARDIMDGVVIERKGLDTKNIIDNSVKVVSIIEKKISKMSYNEKIDYINNLISSLTKLRTSIYEKNSKDLYDLETGKKNGYEIEIKSLKNIEIIYMVNYINKLFSELKIKLTDENNQIEDKNNLLF
ncbi:MAG: phosphodiester glycosidase family protein [Candidatus Gracilibacteria bacterium]|nr:phosphodiester glycosidase family protein [Candidatus Gracilibacteria bacterium]